MARKDHQPASVYGGQIAAELLDFATGQVQAVRVDGGKSPNDPPPAWIVRNLLKYGALAYVPDGDPLGGFYIYNAAGFVDRYARPMLAYARTQATAQTTLELSTIWGGGSARILRANPTCRPPQRTIDRYAAFVGACDVALMANVRGSMRSQIIGAPKKMGDTIECMLDDAARGMPTILTDEQLAQITTLDVSVPFNALDVHALRQKVYAEAIKHFGGITPTEYKAERVQAAEVSAHVAEAIDSVYIMIDTFNEDAAEQGVPWRLEYVGMGSAYENNDPDQNQKGGNEDGT